MQLVQLMASLSIIVGIAHMYMYQLHIVIKMDMVLHVTLGAACAEEVITVLGLCVCLLRVYTPLKAFIQLDVCIDWLNAKIRFSTYRFLQNCFFQKVNFGMLAFTVHALIAHASVLTCTRCTHDINPAPMHVNCLTGISTSICYGVHT